MKNNKGFINIILIIAIVAIIGGTGYYIFNKTNQSVKDEGGVSNIIEKAEKTKNVLEDRNEEASATEDWKTYRSEKFDFKTQYPANWSVREENIPLSSQEAKGPYYEKSRIWFESSWIEEEGYSPAKISIIVYIHDNSQDLDIESWYQNYFISLLAPGGYRIDMDTVIVGKYEDEVIKSGEFLQVIVDRITKRKSFFLKKETGNLVYQIEQSYPVEGQPYSEKAKVIFEKFSASFNFLTR